MKALFRPFAVALVGVVGMIALPMSAAAAPAPAAPALRVSAAQQARLAPATALSSSVTSSYHALWQWDSYDGQPVTNINLASGLVSGAIYVNFLNRGPGTWNSNTVLALWDGTTDNGPADGMQWCHAPGSDWLTCNPGIPAWDGQFAVGPGGSFTFEFQIQAPVTTHPITRTLYWRPAELINGSYQWIDALPSDGLYNNWTYDYFTVFVAAAS
jgi:hypothetical protein